MKIFGFHLCLLFVVYRFVDELPFKIALFALIILAMVAEVIDRKKLRRLRAYDEYFAQRAIINKRMEKMAVDRLYGRVPEAVYQRCCLLRGYYSLEEWQAKEPQTYCQLSEEKLKEYEEKLYQIQLES